jgi:maleylpyruvate isomerase
VKLYDYWRSSSAWRARIALHWKGVAFERQPVNLLGAPDAPSASDARARGEQHEATFTALNPFAQVPVLELDDAESGGSPVRQLAQSLAILEYLEECYPEPPLLPADRLLRARARQLALMVVSGIQPMQNMSTLRYVKRALGGEPTAFVQHFIAPGLAALEAVASETSKGSFLVGDSVSFADVCLVPQLYAARRFAVDLQRLPILLRAEAACAVLPAFAAAHPDQQSDRPPSPGV